MATDLLTQGVFDYLVKPVDKDKLLATVAAAMEQRLALRHDY
jgi:two-component system chemotaxis response regulator CheY